MLKQALLKPALPGLNKEKGKLRQAIAEFIKLYPDSPDLHKVVTAMLEWDPATRPDFKLLYKLLVDVGWLGAGPDFNPQSF